MYVFCVSIYIAIVALKAHAVITCHKLNIAHPYWNVPWPARVYKICILKFAFEVRWLHGTLPVTLVLCLYMYTNLFEMSPTSYQ